MVPLGVRFLLNKRDLTEKTEEFPNTAEYSYTLDIDDFEFVSG